MGDRGMYYTGSTSNYTTNGVWIIHSSDSNYYYRIEETKKEKEKEFIDESEFKV